MRSPDRGADPASKLGRDYRALLASSTISNLGDGIALIAYPWLASAVTRNAVLIALVAVVQRLPWLLFSLPAGVITDRMNRRTLMIKANVVRAILTMAVAVVVMTRQGSLRSPTEIQAGINMGDTDLTLYATVLAATLFLGIAEVLHDNAAQTLMPAIVDARSLQKANGRLWSTEQIANSFVGPPLAAALLVISFSVPFFVDAATFAVSVALLSLIPADKAQPSPSTHTKSWRAELAEGFRWLWGHDLLRQLAIILGLLNGLAMVSGAILVLFAQEVLNTSPTEFAILWTGAAVGAVIGGLIAEAVTRRIGPGRALMLTLISAGATSIATGLTSLWPVAWLMLMVGVMFGTVWNVITVSLRQEIIPDRLLGRVNSVYRFFAWGSIPMGAMLGGLIVSGVELFASRDFALRMPWIVSGVAQLLLLVYAAPRLTTARIESARASASHDGSQPE